MANRMKQYSRQYQGLRYRVLVKPPGQREFEYAGNVPANERDAMKKRAHRAYPRCRVRWERE